MHFPPFHIGQLSMGPFAAVCGAAIGYSMLLMSPYLCPQTPKMMLVSLVMTIPVPIVVAIYMSAVAGPTHLETGYWTLGDEANASQYGEPANHGKLPTPRFTIDMVHGTAIPGHVA